MNDGMEHSLRKVSLGIQNMVKEDFDTHRIQLWNNKLLKWKINFYWNHSENHYRISQLLMTESFHDSS